MVNKNGNLGLVLHSHLPYVHHPEKEKSLEEYWFFDALAETYLPLLKMLEKLWLEGIDYKITISLSPTLVTMFQDELLQDRFLLYLRNKIELGIMELERNKSNPALLKISQLYKEHYEKCF